mgnify:FL=1
MQEQNAASLEQTAAQHNIEQQNYVEMLRSNLPTLAAEHMAGRYLLAELTRAGDVKVKKAQFMKAAGKIQGGVPPLTEVALRIIAGKPRK